MPQVKSVFRIAENKKLRIFILKVLVYSVLLYLSKVSKPFGEWVKEVEGLSNIINAFLFLLGANILISLARMLTARIYLRKQKEENLHPNFLLGIAWISNILNSIVFISALIMAFGLRPFEFLTSLTIVAAAIAIVSKEYITNTINGLIIMFTDQFSLGDTIKINDQKGIIKDITLLNTVLKRDDGLTMMIPNNLMLSTHVINYRFTDRKDVEFLFEVPIETQLSLKEIKEKIEPKLKKRLESKEISKFVVGLDGVFKEKIAFKLIVGIAPEREPEIREEFDEILLELLYDKK
ncbi:mechanosensitive ion channel family protein [Cecembia lonarensis]|uniref:Mechanosensitive ion channel n=1 Tax=Cecembia lonarensis (strain CCUG 58316 / KCTC 22772 / LW9) TaxID=1225176 RepID=K1LL28_CECL9|nr:mechanosensitive ion channel domain-containing protein [Cecembia lonarensis]EKB51098.1 Mechanosensitive ion channel [Cecembia lonarensis LW9]